MKKRNIRRLLSVAFVLSTSLIAGLVTKNIVDNKNDSVELQSATYNTETPEQYVMPYWMDYFYATEVTGPNDDNGSNTDSDFSVDVQFQINSFYTGSLDQIYIIPNAAEPSTAIKLNNVEVGKEYSLTLQYDQWGVGAYQIQMGFGDYTNPANVWSLDYVYLNHMDYVLNPVTNITTTGATISYTINEWGQTDNVFQYRVYALGTTIGAEAGWITYEPTTLGTGTIPVTGLTSQTDYVIEMRVDGDNTTKQYQFFTTSTNYSSITGVSVLPLQTTATSAAISFDYTENDGNGIVQYRVYKTSEGVLPGDEYAPWITYSDTVVANDNTLNINSYYASPRIGTGATDYTLKSLEPNTQYTVEIRADGWNNTIQRVSFTTANSSIVDITGVDDVTSDSATINYIYERNGGAGVVEYRYYTEGTAVNKRGDWTTVSNLTPGVGNYLTLRNLEPGTSYVFEIRVDGRGVDTIKFTTESLATVSGVSVFTSLDSATITYQLDTTGLTHTPTITYQYREAASGGSWTTGTDTGATAGFNTFDITGLNEGTIYELEILVDGVVNYSSTFTTNKYSEVSAEAVTNVGQTSATIALNYNKYGGIGDIEFQFVTTSTADDDETTNPWVKFDNQTGATYASYTYSTLHTGVWGEDGQYYITFDGLTPNTGYTLNVKDSQSGRSDSISFVTSDGQKSYITGLTMNDVKDTTATAQFSFVQGNTGTTEYYWAVEKVGTPSSSYQWTVVSGVTSGVQTVDLTGLEQNTEYVFSIKVDGIATSVIFKTNSSGVISGVTVDESTITDDYAKITYTYTQNYGDSNDVYYRYHISGTDPALATWIQISNINIGTNVLELSNLAAGTEYVVEFKVDGNIVSTTSFTTAYLTTVEPTGSDVQPTQATMYFDYEKNAGDGVVEYRYYNTKPDNPEDGWVEMTDEELSQGYVVIGDDEEDLEPGTTYLLEIRTDQYISDAGGDGNIGTTNEPETYIIGSVPTYIFSTPQSTYASAQLTTNVTSTSATLNYTYYEYAGTGQNAEYRVINQEDSTTTVDWTYANPTQADGAINSIQLTDLTPDTYYLVEYRVYNPALDDISIPGREEAYVYSYTTFYTLDVAHITDLHVDNLSFDSTNVIFEYDQNDGAGLVEYKVDNMSSQTVEQDWTTYSDIQQGTNVLKVDGLEEETEYQITFVLDKESKWSETATLIFVTSDDGFYVLLVWIVVIMAMTIITSGAGITYFIGKNEKKHNKDKKELESHITAKSMNQDAEIKKHLVEEHQKQAQDAENKRLSV